MAVEKIQVPDLGSDDTVEVIEVLVKAGDSIGENDSLVVLESDKAAMEVPAPKGGVVKELLVKVGDQVKTGSDLLMLEAGGSAAVEAPADEPAQQKAPEEKAPAKAAQDDSAAAAAPKPAQAAGKASVQTINVPDLGGATDVEIIDILVKEGDTVDVEGGLITLETDKAAMDVPAPAAGKVVALKVKVGDKVSQGSPILDLETTASAGQPEAAEPPPEPAASAEAKAEPAAVNTGGEQHERPQSNAVPAASSGAEVYAGPAVRRLARELGVELSQVQGSGAKGRVVKEDILAFVKSRLQGGGGAATSAAGGSGVPGIPDQDFSRFGAVEDVEMSKLHRVTAQNMTRNWLNVPHVTQFDEADITELEAFRGAQKALAEKKGIKLTPLPFIVKACAQALREHPQFNVSLHSSGMKLVRKNYVHIGVAVATPAGLMVPVVRDADKKSIWEIAAEIAALSAKAKDRKLTKQDMEGSCFTVSSLGNLGGTGFTPIVNAPEVAILGVSRADTKPVWRDKQFVPRTIMPFSLSYDHRAVNGVDGGQFCTYLGRVLSDIRLLLL